MSDQDGYIDLDEAAVEAWQIADARAAEIRAAWREAGSPMVTSGGATGKAVVAHPLLREMELAERHAARLRELVRKRQMGRPPTAVIGGRIASPSSRLRAKLAAEKSRRGSRR
jgi:hypothetical protein